MKFKNLIIDSNETLYEISENGDIRNKKRKTILKQQNSKGYMRVGLSINKKGKTFFVHRLVAMTFVENSNPDTFNVVNHLDGNPLNNNYKNLEWTDMKGNTQHAWDLGLAKPTTERAVSQYDLNGVFIKTFKSAMEAEREIEKVSQPKITLCCQNKRKTHAGFQWRYAEENLQHLNRVSVSTIEPKKVLQIDKNGQIINQYNSTREAAKAISGTQSAISRCCNGAAKTHKGFSWKFS